MPEKKRESSSDEIPIPPLGYQPSVDEKEDEINLPAADIETV